MISDQKIRKFGLNALVAADRQTASNPDETNQQASSEQDSQPGALTPVARNGT